MTADGATETPVSHGTGDSAVGTSTTSQSAQRHPSEGRTQTGERSDRLTSRLAVVALLAALTPLLVAAVRAIRAGWVPVGDSALIAIRSRDVLGGGELPLVGMWSSSSWSAGFDFNHPGPLFYDLLAVPAALFPGGTGQVVGAVLVQGLAVLGIFLLARRRGDATLAIAAMAVTVLLCWAMGSAVLVEPWHANTLLLPFVCFLLLVWSLACGDVACLPWAVGVGSLLVQTNLAYGVFVPTLLFGGVVGWVIGRRRGSDNTAPAGDSDRAGGADRASESGDSPESDGAVETGDSSESDLPGAADRSSEFGESRASGGATSANGQRLRRVGVVTAMVVVACWVQPLVEQFFGTGEGNLSRVVRSLGEPVATLNWGRSLRVVARVVALPPWWGRPSYSEAFVFGPFGNPLPSLVLSILSLVAVAGLLVWCLRDARRREDRVVTTAVGLALALVLLAIVTANVTPTVPAYGTVAYQLRWLWPVGVFVVFALLAWLVRRFVPDGVRLSRVAAVLLAVTVVVALLNLAQTTGGTTAPAPSLDVARDLLHDVAAADLEGPLLVDCDEGTYDPYCEPVMFELQRLGVPFVVRDDVEIRQLGERRRWDGSNAVATLRVVAGDFAIFTPDGAEQIVLHEGLDAAAKEELFFLREELKAAATDGELRLNERGLRVAARGDLDSARVTEASAELDPERLVAVRELPFGEHRRDLVAMVREDLLDLGDDADLAARLTRYADLQEQWDLQTVAVYRQPLR